MCWGTTIPNTCYPVACVQDAASLWVGSFEAVKFQCKSIWCCTRTNHVFGIPTPQHLSPALEAKYFGLKRKSHQKTVFGFELFGSPARCYSEGTICSCCSLSGVADISLESILSFDVEALRPILKRSTNCQKLVCVRPWKRLKQLVLN